MKTSHQRLDPGPYPPRSHHPSISMDTIPNPNPNPRLLPSEMRLAGSAENAIKMYESAREKEIKKRPRKTHTIQWHSQPKKSLNLES